MQTTRKNMNHSQKKDSALYARMIIPFAGGDVIGVWRRMPDRKTVVEYSQYWHRVVETPRGHGVLIRTRPHELYPCPPEQRRRTLSMVLRDIDKSLVQQANDELASGDYVARKNAYHEMIAHFGGTKTMELLTDYGYDTLDHAYISAMKASAEVWHMGGQKPVVKYRIPDAFTVFAIHSKVISRLEAWA